MKKSVEAMKEVKEGYLEAKKDRNIKTWLYKTCRQFGVSQRTLRYWIKELGLIGCRLNGQKGPLEAVK